MTIFSDNPHDRRIERFMTAIPNFKPRGVGVRFSESQILIAITTATPTEILAETMRQIRCPPFRKRFNEYILKLTDEEQLLIYRHYYAGISGTGLAEIYGVSQQAISKRIAKIRAKLKNLLEN